VNEIIRSIQLSEGQFSLTLAHCRYSGLRYRVAQFLKKKSPVHLREISLPNSITTLYTFLHRKLENKTPNPVMLLGIESVTAIDDVLISANYVREEFRKNFPFALIIWVDDVVLSKMESLAPDFKSWAGAPIFIVATDNELIDALQQNSDILFDEILKMSGSQNRNTSIADLLKPSEFKSFLKDMEDRNLPLDPKMKANLRFLQGKNAEN